MTDPALLEMPGAAESNLADDGTWGHLSPAENLRLFHMPHDDEIERRASIHHPPEGGFHTVAGATNSATVSPHDVFAHTDSSLPPSASFTDWTAPSSTFPTPDDDEYLTSPLMGDSHGGDLLTLFPLDTELTRASTSSGNQIMVHPGGETRKRRSTTGASLGSDSRPDVTHATVAGVGARKRDKRLPPIFVNEDDPVAVKRARNTAAARKSRAKRCQEQEKMADKIVQLKKDVDYWKARALSHAVASAMDE